MSMTTLKTITGAVNGLTTEQYVRLLNIAHPLTVEEQHEFDKMSDDELLEDLLS